MRLVVGLPAFNEAKTLGGVLQRIPRAIAGIRDIIAVVVDDGSTDATATIGRDAGAVVIRHGHNRGLGVAFQSIVRYALQVKTDILVTIDSDGQFDAADIPALIEPLVSGEAEVCTASRFLDPAITPAMPFIKRWGNRQVAQLVSALTGKQYRDVSCGFRAYSREALLWLTVHHSFTYTHEVFLDLASKHIAIREIPLRIQGSRSSGESKVAASVVRYGFHTALIMLRTYRDWRPLRLCWYPQRAPLPPGCLLAGRLAGAGCSDGLLAEVGGPLGRSNQRRRSRPHLLWLHGRHDEAPAEESGRDALFPAAAVHGIATEL